MVKKKKRRSKEKELMMLKQARKRNRKNVRGWERKRERKKKMFAWWCMLIQWKCVRLREHGAVHWGRSRMDSITMYRPSERVLCEIYIHPWKKFHSTYLPIYFSWAPPSYQPPVAPSHSSYEPRAGRSEYNFLYCVNVRTYVWIRKMFILYETPGVESLRLSTLV